MQDLNIQVEVLAGLGSWEQLDNTTEVVLEGLSHQDSAMRLSALGIAAEELDPDLAEVIVRLLDTGPDDEVRAQAAVALGPALEEMNAEEDWEGPELGDLPLSMERFHLHANPAGSKRKGSDCSGRRNNAEVDEADA